MEEEINKKIKKLLVELESLDKQLVAKKTALEEITLRYEKDTERMARELNISSKELLGIGGEITRNKTILDEIIVQRKNVDIDIAQKRSDLQTIIDLAEKETETKNKAQADLADFVEKKKNEENSLIAVREALALREKNANEKDIALSDENDRLIKKEKDLIARENGIDEKEIALKDKKTELDVREKNISEWKNDSLQKNDALNRERMKMETLARETIDLNEKAKSEFGIISKQQIELYEGRMQALEVKEKNVSERETQMARSENEYNLRQDELAIRERKVKIRESAMAVAE